MNCQGITDLLDDGDIGRMTAAERNHVEAHLASCPMCAAEWALHQRLVTTSAPPVPAGLEAHCRALLAANAAGNVRRLPSRAILVGTLFVMAAAAAILGMWLGGSSPNMVAVEASPSTPPVTTPVVVAAAPAKDLPAQPTAAGQTPAALAPGSFTVRVPPLRIEVEDAAGVALAQRFRDRVIEKLGRVPDLVVVDQTAASDYQVRISFASRSTSTTIAEVDATTSAAFAAADAAMESIARTNPDDQWRRRLEFEKQGVLRSGTAIRAAAMQGLPSSIALLLGNGFPRPAILDDKLLSQAGGGADRVELSAEMLVRDLRTKVFPLTPSLERELLATLGDSSQRYAERRRALAGLLSIALRRGGIPAMDAAAVRAGAEFALAESKELGPEQAMLWNALALTRNPELVPYLIRAMDSAPTAARLHLLKILARDFADDPRARPALEAASQLNSESVVRMAGVRESRDESRWNEYVVASLKDSGLSDMQRLQPIADMVPDSAAFAAGNVRLEYQLDDQTVRELGTLIQSVVQIPDRSRYPDAEINMATNALKVLATMKSPVAADVMVEVLRAREPRVRFLKTPALTLALQQFSGDPKVRGALEEMARSTDPLDMGVMAKTTLHAMDLKADLERRRQQREPDPSQ